MDVRAAEESGLRAGAKPDQIHADPLFTKLRASHRIHSRAVSAASQTSRLGAG